MAAITKNHRLNGLNDRNLFLKMKKIKLCKKKKLFLTILEIWVPGWSVSEEGPLPASCLPAKTWHGTESSDVSLFCSPGTYLVMRDLPMTSSKFDPVPKMPPLNIITSRASTQVFGKDTSIHGNPGL